MSSSKRGKASKDASKKKLQEKLKKRLLITEERVLRKSERVANEEASSSKSLRCEYASEIERITLKIQDALTNNQNKTTIADAENSTLYNIRTLKSYMREQNDFIHVQGDALRKEIRRLNEFHVYNDKEIREKFSKAKTLFDTTKAKVFGLEKEVNKFEKVIRKLL